MSDKQREKHLAMYWNGPLTRSEAQKVFDQTAGVIQKQQEVIQKMDLVLAFLVEKAGHTTEEIQAWMNERVKQMHEAHEAAQKDKKETAQEENKAPEEQSVVLA